MNKKEMKGIVSMFADGTPLSADVLGKARDSGLIFLNGGDWSLTEFGRSFLPNSPDSDSYLAPKRQLDMVNQPPHYISGAIECIDAIRAALSPEEFRGFCKGNAIKYSWREKLKGGNEDLKKAAWYLAKVTEQAQ